MSTTAEPQNQSLVLSYTEQQEVRKSYGYYKNIRMYDGDERNYETRQEMYEHKEEIFNEICEKVPQLKEFLNNDISKFYLVEPFIYSKNQLKFIEEADEQSLDVHYAYSGRGMYGDVCPSVTVEHTSDFQTTAKYRTDSMGYNIVMYAQY